MQYDVDTIHLVNKEINYNDLKGREEVIINANLDEFLNNPVKVIRDNISTIISIHQSNVYEMEYLNRYFKGKQDILDKVRANGDKQINNKHITNYAWEFVNFKKGYYVGKPIKYVNLDVENNDDIKYLNMYNRNVNKSSKDLVKYENMLITGIAHTMVIPSRKDYDTEKNSPYEYIVLDNKNVCVVKSNDIFKTKLCSICFSTIKENDSDIPFYTIYYENNVLQLKGSELELVKSEKYPIYNPITEYQLNEQRMGVFEPIINSLNSLNMIRSNQMDLLEEIVNKYLTFENVDISQVLEKIDEFRKKKILAVNTNGPHEAKVGSVDVSSDTNTTNSTYNDIEQRSYDIVGVPMPTSSTGQGVSGEAQVYGGGWENAQTIANVDTEYIKQFEREDLEKMLYISEIAINSKTTNLNPYNIEIKYTINKSNNMLVKSQTFKYLRDLGVPFEQALEMSELTDDPHTIAKLSEENVVKEKQQEIEFEIERENKLNEIKSQNQSTNEDIQEE